MVAAVVCGTTYTQVNHKVVKTIDFTKKDGGVPRVENRSSNGQSRIVKSYDFTKNSGSIRGATVIGRENLSRPTQTSQARKTQTASTQTSPKTTQNKAQIQKTNTVNTVKTSNTKQITTNANYGKKNTNIQTASKNTASNTKTVKTANRQTAKTNYGKANYQNAPKVANTQNYQRNTQNNAAKIKLQSAEPQIADQQVPTPKSSYNITLGSQVPANSNLGSSTTLAEASYQQPQALPLNSQPARAPSNLYAFEQQTQSRPVPAQIITALPITNDGQIQAYSADPYASPSVAAPAITDNTAATAATTATAQNNGHFANLAAGGAQVVRSEKVSEPYNANSFSSGYSSQEVHLTQNVSTASYNPNLGQRVRLNSGNSVIPNNGEGVKIKLNPMPEIQTRNLVSPNEHGSVILVQKGKASYYGAKFHGKRTASGERFNMYGYTAAHPTLPFGTKVQVINLHNGRVVTVRINDRGPHSSERIIDLSKAAADMLQMGKSGTALVRIKAYQ